MNLSSIENSSFSTIQVPQSLLKGQPIGFGKCKAVRIHFNGIVRNATLQTSIPERQIYIGDANLQEYEIRVLDGFSAIIITDRLEKIYVRNPFATLIYLQLQIFH